jgi:tryptophan synthase beta chain
VESAHAVAGALKVAADYGPDDIMLINLSGRGDKDMDTAIDWFHLGDADGDGAAEPLG